ncbi:hypothetical protein Nepgr_007327 [Nepenthes gracilis]|uniref:GDSL esterase/lipase n=1 Tax=Nepenthes gracilis TaxID=150966 RepID=A0AAD3XI67_NEPGR|nr:hypothetical protein Nepgr_007327 [Nepenthes gracilis]
MGLNTPVSAVFVFGDSTSDPGNNNFVSTPFRSNFTPYGRDFANHKATGRFTNGRLTSDFIAGYAGIKEYVPPYLDPTLSDEELLTGVSFASAASGYDPFTPRISKVIPMQKQLEYFKEYRSRIEQVIGKDKATQLVERALFLIVAGTNDFVLNYYAVPFRRVTFTVPQYQLFVLQIVHQFIQDLWGQGARKILVAGLPPMGCLPIVITTNAFTNNIFNHQRNCVESLSTVARNYNQLLQLELNIINIRLAAADPRTAIFYLDIYAPLAYLVQGPGRLGFEVVSRGCCGTGYVETSFLCNSKSHVCSDASKYVFWDSIHPTERAYYLVFMALRPVIDFIIRK